MGFSNSTTLRHSFWRTLPPARRRGILYLIIGQERNEFRRGGQELAAQTGKAL
jgi:hypothetical protein